MSSLESSLTPTQTITTHNSDGSVAIHPSLPIVFSPLNPAGRSVEAGTVFTTHSHPVVLDADIDIQQHAEWIAAPNGFIPRDGALAVMNRFPPGAEVPVHRTQSIDFGVVVEGELELVFADGGRKLFRRGDVIVQRETAHGWRNPSLEREALAFFVAVAAQPVRVGERVLGEELEALGMDR
ncbi:hypothetical protein DRE_06567 [Drechslerella stenobrocha 248]|uniref:Cupin type-2 domain-containing protein n=1 Tax=Drechslerella stenobrocha 248 TaxID=1043628 RepID=W7HL02_9PEZI|nr:hypothetical protein DRE_06567 [Drechslerella stenobrocha 248]